MQTESWGHSREDIAQLTEADFLAGQILLVDKPLEWSSFQAVNKLKWAIRKRFALKKIKIGHAGTLDPLATGLLIICTGKFTKRIPSYQGQEKTYTGRITLGATTPSYDLETEIDQRYPYGHVTPQSIQKATESFTGDILQAPPVFSALKKEGKRLYEYAREGTPVAISKRAVTINEFTIEELKLPHIHFKVCCSKGTYIRSLAHDFGQHLESGAHLSGLRRTKIGDFNVDKALSPETISNLILGK